MFCVCFMPQKSFRGKPVENSVSCPNADIVKDTVHSSAGGWGCACCLSLSRWPRPTCWPPPRWTPWGQDFFCGPWRRWRSIDSPYWCLCVYWGPQTGGPGAPIRFHQWRLFGENKGGLSVILLLVIATSPCDLIPALMTFLRSFFNGGHSQSSFSEN